MWLVVPNLFLFNNISGKMIPWWYLYICIWWPDSLAMENHRHGGKRERERYIYIICTPFVLFFMFQELVVRCAAFNMSNSPGIIRIDWSRPTVFGFLLVLTAGPRAPCTRWPVAAQLTRFMTSVAVAVYTLRCHQTWLAWTYLINAGFNEKMWDNPLL